MKSISELLQDIGGQPVYDDRGLPEELCPFSCFVPDSGYCVLSIPTAFEEEATCEPECYTLPLPEKYVLEKGWRMIHGFPGVDVPYSDTLGAVIPEDYSTWE